MSCGTEIGKQQETNFVKKENQLDFFTWVRIPWSWRSLVNEVMFTIFCHQYCPKLYRQCPPRRVKDSNISDIENNSCVRNVMEVTVVSWIERVPWGPAIILKIVNDGVFICTCNVEYIEYDCWIKHIFVYDSNFKTLHRTKYFGVLVDNRSDAPICVLEDKDI